MKIDRIIMILTTWHENIKNRTNKERRHFMKAAVYTKYGAPKVLKIKEV